VPFSEVTATYSAGLLVAEALVVVVVNLVVDGIAVAVLDFAVILVVIGSVVVVGGLEAFPVVGDIVLAPNNLAS
jgi:hypothetical protein